MAKVEVLGVKIDDITMEEAVNLVESWLSKPGKHYVVTPNPEFLVSAQSDPEFKEILNEADLSIPDGAGLWLSGKVKSRVTGVDLMEKLVELSAQNGLTVGFLGGKEAVAQKAADNLKKRYPGLKISLAMSGGVVNESGQWSLTTHYQLQTTDLLFVALGHIKQEKWIAKNLPRLNVKVAMGVGGAFDYLSGEVPRAPKWMRELGLEWLFRLFIQPWRIKRQFALLKYLWLLLRG